MAKTKTKIWILGAIKSFIVTTRMGHLIICIKIPKTLIFWVSLRPIEFEGKVAKNADFSQKSSIFDVFMHIDNSYNTKNERGTGKSSWGENSIF